LAEGGRGSLRSRVRHIKVRIPARGTLKRPEVGTDGVFVEPAQRIGSSPDPLQSSTSEEPLILVVDDEPLLLRSMRRILQGSGRRVALAETLTDATDVLAEPDLAVVLLDLKLRSGSGLHFLEQIKAERPEVEVVMMTGHASVESAVGCMRLGAFDYLEKPFDDVHRVRTTLDKALERRSLVRRNLELERELRGRAASPELVGASPRMRTLSRTIASLRHNQSRVLIHGASGTGKELVARAIHAVSERAEKPFVPVDCGALPESIIESELFGHERGAFTGALGSPGLFRMAEGGTLFLDEIGELPNHVQAKLLRALQQNEVRPVGAAHVVPVDLRVIAATHRDLDAMVAEGTFRADLFYRLNVVRVGIPSLRERREDIPLLVHHFLRAYRRREAPVEGIDDDALQLLVEQDWPGNVRELENTVESALALAPGPRLRLGDLPIVRSGRGSTGYALDEALPLTLASYERAALERALRESRGDATDAARSLGIGRSTFYRKLARHGLGGARPGVGSAGSIR
jgi:two-component system response regulator HydG